MHAESRIDRCNCQSILSRFLPFLVSPASTEVAKSTPASVENKIVIPNRKIYLRSSFVTNVRCKLDTFPRRSLTNSRTQLLRHLIRALAELLKRCCLLSRRRNSHRDNNTGESRALIGRIKNTVAVSKTRFRRKSEGCSSGAPDSHESIIDE